MTLTIDDDVAVQLERLRRRGKGSLKDLINGLLREGLRRTQTSPSPAGTYRTPSVDLGRCLVGNVDDVSAALSTAEGDASAASPACAGRIP